MGSFWSQQTSTAPVAATAAPEQPLSEQGAKTMDLRTFDPSSLAPTAVVLQYGPRGTGKTTRTLAWLKRAGVPGANVRALTLLPEEWASRVPGVVCLPEQPSGEALNELLGASETSKAAGGDVLRVVWDDCWLDAEDAGVRKRISDAAVRARFIKRGFWFNLQYSRILPKRLRSNADVVVVCRERDVQHLRIIWEDHFRAAFPSFDEFSSVVDLCTRAFGALVLDNTVVSDDLRDKLFVDRPQSAH